MPGRFLGGTYSKEGIKLIPAHECDLPTPQLPEGTVWVCDCGLAWRATSEKRSRTSWPLYRWEHCEALDETKD